MSFVIYANPVHFPDLAQTSHKVIYNRYLSPTRRAMWSEMKWWKRVLVWLRFMPHPRVPYIIVVPGEP